MGTYGDGAGNCVDILGLDDGLEVVLNDLGEVVLELRAAEVGDDLSPVRTSILLETT